MAASQQWDSFFSNWPKTLARKGVLLTNLSETMPFKDFWMKDGMVLVERTTPDAMGARFVLLSFDVVNVVKFTTPLTTAEIAEAGFQAEALQKSPPREPQLV